MKKIYESGKGVCHIPKKLLLVMKLTAFLFVVFTMQVTATVYSQNKKLSLNMQGNSIKEVLQQIEAQSEYRFIYENEKVNLDAKVSIRVTDEVVEKILKQLFEKDGINYSITNNNLILINPSEKQMKSSGSEPTNSQQQKSVSGKVTDSSGGTLPGVSVVVKGTTTGVITDMDGKYSLPKVPENAILQFSFVGMKTQEIAVGVKTTINVVLAEEAIGLDEVVAVGYGTMKKSDLTGSVTSVTSKDFSKGVTTNALQLLSGKASGVSISQSNSEPGGSLSIRVRGAGSINSDNSVLVVIDGLPGADPSTLNPSDIESMEILKDASAAAIYGTRAANGVVLITTKKGVSGVPLVSYNTYVGYQTPTYKFDVLNATHYLQMINDISKDAGKTLPFTDAQISAAGKGTDFQDALFRNAYVHNHQLSLTGGTNNAKYYVSLGYLDQNGIMISSGIKKYTTLVNLELNPSQRFRFGLSLNAAMSLKDIIPNSSDSPNENADPLNAAIQFDPRLSAKKNVDGVYEMNPSIALDNPVAMGYGYDDNDRNNGVSGNTFGEFTILPGLKISERLGVKIINDRYDSYKDRTTQKGAASGGIGSISSYINNYWMAETVVNYDKKFKEKHHLTLMGGATWEKFENLSQYSYASGFLSDVTNTNLLSSGTKATFDVNSSKSVRTLQSLFGRANYTYADKYLLTATIRRDGTSRFSTKNKFAFFPSVAVGWRISQEPFMKSLNKISNLKLRFGYGQMGNEGINNFETIQTFVSGGNAILGGLVQNGAQPARIANTDLVWETTEEYNAGFDFGFFNNRITGDVEYYIKNTNDQLFNKPIPMSTGFSSVRTNFGQVRNSGIDLTLNTQNIKGKLNWNTTFTVSTLKNKVTELPPFVGDIITTGGITFSGDYAVVMEGVPMQAYYGYKVTGIFQQGDNIASSAQPTAKPGEPIFLDYKKDGKIDAYDRVVLGKPFPDVTYSMNNSLRYKNWNLEIYVMGVQGIESMNVNVLESLKPINFDRNILTEHYLDRWTVDNPQAKYPSGVNSSVYFNGGKVVNSYVVQDASFFRVKNITLGYQIPIRKSSILKSTNLYMSCENVLTITNFEGFDPDANQTDTSIAKASYNNYPLARVFRIGANINF
jgi:TonB-linked SusC/RagA family outer membrane protein